MTKCVCFMVNDKMSKFLEFRLKVRLDRFSEKPRIGDIQCNHSCNFELYLDRTLHSVLHSSNLTLRCYISIVYVGVERELATKHNTLIETITIKEGNSNSFTCIPCNTSANYLILDTLTIVCSLLQGHYWSYPI